MDQIRANSVYTIAAADEQVQSIKLKVRNSPPHLDLSCIPPITSTCICKLRPGKTDRQILDAHS